MDFSWYKLNKNVKHFHYCATWAPHITAKCVARIHGIWWPKHSKIEQNKICAHLSWDIQYIRLISIVVMSAKTISMEYGCRKYSLQKGLFERKSSRTAHDHRNLMYTRLYFFVWWIVGTCNYVWQIVYFNWPVFWMAYKKAFCRPIHGHQCAVRLLIVRSCIVIVDGDGSCPLFSFHLQSEWWAVILFYRSILV